MRRTQKAAMARHALLQWEDGVVFMGWFWWFVGFFWSGKIFAEGAAQLTAVETLILLEKFWIFITAARLIRAFFYAVSFGVFDVYFKKRTSCQNNCDIFVTIITFRIDLGRRWCRG
jgi:hypothetical protein